MHPSFKVDEPIQFEIQGNRSFYLYLYVTDPDTGESTLVLPNRRQSGNKYPAGQKLRVPNRQVKIRMGQSVPDL